MNDTCIIKISPERALDRIFKSSPKRSPIRLITCVYRYGYMFITKNIKCFIPCLDNHAKEAMSPFIKLFNKSRRSKIITVGGLERYLKYRYNNWIGDCKKNGNSNSNRIIGINYSSGSVDVSNTTYDLTDDGTGKKYDSGKSMVGTLCRVFPRALLGIGRCITFGTHKYPKPDNWKLVENAFTRYQDSLMRHYLKFLSGEIRDKETNILHLCHMAWNTLAILELYLMEHKEEFDKELFK